MIDEHFGRFLCVHTASLLYSLSTLWSEINPLQSTCATVKWLLANERWFETQSILSWRTVGEDNL